MPKIAFGTRQEATQPDCLKALVVEFITTFIFVFIGVASATTANALAPNSMVGLFAVAVAHALVVGVMISAGHISGGHLNPAVTLGLLFGGHITLSTPVITLASGVGSVQGIVWEIVLTFILLFTVYATIVDPKKGSIDGLGPLLTGLVVGACILAGGSFSGASMNPARSFGPALASWDWTDQWVYWVGPLIGGGLAGFIYENFFIVRTHAPLPQQEPF
ncbi:Major intrinsic protein [Corchorus olitorius]|uniref:Major intrinsic protein n=1 Tax=Corchorus olitorius TaxID=93759 RepID=A0A1R3J8C3_9ROSI|nr:Major intrinsic protein [Corchorus olitorius]